MHANTFGKPQQTANQTGIDTFTSNVVHASGKTDVEIWDGSHNATSPYRHAIGIGIDQTPEYGTDSVDDEDFDIRKASPRAQARWMAPSGLVRH